MSTELITPEASTSDIMLAVGQTQVYEDTGGLPTLRVNYLDEDIDGNPIPKGQFTLMVDGQQVFAPEVDLRIMYATNQLSHYDQAEGKPVATTIYFNNRTDEIPDDAGGYNAGKVSKEELEKLSPAEQEQQKEIKLSRVLFGYVSCEGKTHDGKEIKVEDQPCVYYGRATNFMPVVRYLNALSKNNILMMSVITHITLDKHKRGQVTFWTINPTVKEEVKLERDYPKKVKFFADWVEEQNARIMEKHNNAQADKTIDGKEFDWAIGDDVTELN